MLIFGKRKLQELCIRIHHAGGEHSCDANFGTANLFRKNRKETS